jgi:outer membrane murein-binding lipoprotein Lpp
VALSQWRSVTQRMRLLIPSVLAAATIAAGCGDEVNELDERVDEAQQQVRDAEREVDQAREALEDPTGAATDEARQRLEDAERELREAQQGE